MPPTLQSSPRTRALATTSLLLGLAAAALAQEAPPTPPAPPPPTPGLISGWTLLKEGQADGAIEAPAKHPANPSSNLLKIAVTRYASVPGEGRLGAKNSQALPVEKGQVYDITFNGISEGIGVGLVFSLEADDGKVLARTTLPEIGRGGRGGGQRGRRGGPNATAPATAPAPAPQAATHWRPYLLSLTVRDTSPAAHLVITPIEPVPVWLDNLAINLRKPQ
jgi:hypothetical protein